MVFEFLLPTKVTGFASYFDLTLWFLELIGLLCAIAPVARSLMLVNDLTEDRINVWDFKKSYLKWSKWELPFVVFVLITLLAHGSYIFAAVHGLYVIWIVYQYSNGRLFTIDSTAMMLTKYQDDVASALTYRLVYYISCTFVIFFGLVYFTAQSFIRHPSSMLEVSYPNNIIFE
jgi:hypothetical protein